MNIQPEATASTLENLNAHTNVAQYRQEFRSGSSVNRYDMGNTMHHHASIHNSSEKEDRFINLSNQNATGTTTTENKYL